MMESPNLPGNWFYLVDEVLAVICTGLIVLGVISIAITIAALFAYS